MLTNNTLCVSRNLDRDPGNRVPFRRLPQSPRDAAHLTSESSHITSEDVASSRRQSVERATECYVFMVDDPDRVKLNASLLRSPREIGPELGSLAPFHSAAAALTWMEDFGRVTTRFKLNCRACEPTKCLHIAFLLAAARQNHIIRNSRRVAEVNDARLGSATKRKSMTSREVEAATQQRAIHNQRKQEASHARAAIIRTSIYMEACRLFWLCCGGDLRPTVRMYVLRESA